ncbi:MAG: glycosyltransferase family 2 protein [Methylococcaceae bacterium]
MKTRQPKIKLAAIAKNEAAYIPEWVFHHFYFGFDSIEIWINNTTDNSFEILDLLKENYGPRLDYCNADDFFKECSENNKHFQVLTYQKIFKSAKESGYDFILFLDLDEFWTPSNFTSSIHTLVKDFEKYNPSSISFQWFLDTPDIDRSAFNRPFEAQNLLQKNKHVKSLLNLHHNPLFIRIHNTVYKEGNYFLSNKEIFEETDSRGQHHKALVSSEYFKKNNLNIDRYFIVHKIYRSQLEYVSSLSRARRHTDNVPKIIKDNRSGYLHDERSVKPIPFQISDTDLRIYNLKYNDLIEGKISDHILVAQGFVKKTFESLVVKLGEDNAFFFKKYRHIFKCIQLEEIEAIRKLASIQQTEKNKHCVDFIEVENDLSLSIRGWWFSNGSTLKESDISIHIGDEKIPFVLRNYPRPDVVLNLNEAPLNCGFHIIAENFINYVRRTEKVVIRMKDSQKEFDNPYEEIKKSAMQEAIDFRNNGDFVSAEPAFIAGMKKYPTHLDKYGHPAFKKELMRTLLSQQKWDKATQLIPGQNDAGGGHWHEILFARAYAKTNDINNAKLWWQRVFEREPNNDEAKSFLLKLGISLPPVKKESPAWNLQNIPSRPCMEQAGILLLEAQLKKTAVFLEYGAGGSTVFAAELGVKNIHSVESDKAFLDAVQMKVSSCYPATKVHGHFVNIGKTKEWGHPVNANQAQRWPLYCTAPWRTLMEKDQLPDLILIDGRFRVACFLASVLLAKTGTVILFDDYKDRPHYHVVEKHLRPSKTVGRMAEFIVEPMVSDSLLVLDLIAYSTNPE